MPVVDSAAREMIIHLLVHGRRDADCDPDEPNAHDQVDDLAIDWEQIWTIAEMERVAPLLYHTTRNVGQIPAWWRERCRTAYHETGILNTLRVAELKALLADFRAAGLEVIVLKGAALVELVYGNPALRPMVDLDLLVHRRDVESGIHLLAQRDYQKAGYEISPGSTLAYENEVLLQKQAPYGWQIELHWNLFDSPYYQQRLPESEWWRTADFIDIDGEPVRCLSSEWMLIHLCGHLAFHHHGQGLLWWNDIAELIRKRADRLDWEYLIAQAQRANIILPLKSIIPVLADEWKTPVPKDVIDRLHKITPDAEEIKVNEALTSGRFSPGRRMWVDAKGMEAPRDRARFVLHNILPSAAYMDARYGIRHPWTRPVYYVYRWVLGLSGVVHEVLSRGNSRRKPS